MSEDTRVPDVTATVSATAAELSIGDERRQLSGSNMDAVREAVRREVAALAAQLGQSVPFTAEENGARYRLIVHPDGSVNADDVAPAPQQPSAQQPSAPQPSAQQPGATAAGTQLSAPVYGPATGRPAASPVSAIPVEQARTDAEAAPEPPADPRTDQSGRRTWPPQTFPGPAANGARAGASAPSPSGPESEPQPRHAVSFLPPERPVELPTAPAQPQGWWARRFGKTNEPDPAIVAAQRAEAADQALVSKHWPGPKTIAVVNGKGGSGKTPTTAFLSAVFARYGGGGVIAWDNNDTRGTLGWRTASGGHDKTVLDLIPAAEQLMDRDAQIGRLAAFVHHQPEDKYDVLRSNPELLAQDQRLSTEQFRALHAVANRFYRMIFMDSGNDESTYAWLNMIEAADQIVVPTSTRPDHAEAGVLLLDALRNRNAECRTLAERAVVIVSQADQDEAAADTIAAGFRQLLPAENVVTIPYDRGIRDSQLRYDRLSPATQRAFLRAAAAVAGQL